MPRQSSRSRPVTATSQRHIRFFGAVYVQTADGFCDTRGNRATEAVVTLLRPFWDQDVADTQAAGPWVTFRELPGAGPLAVGFANNTNKLICSEFGDSPELLRRASAELGGVAVASRPGFDVVVDFACLPRVGIRLQFNAAQSPFPAQCALCFRESAVQCLGAHGLYTLGTYLAGRLCQGRQNRSLGYIEAADAAD